MKKIIVLLIACSFTSVLFHSCKTVEKEITEKSALLPGTFGYDLNFLKKTDKPVVLKDATGRSQIIVSPKYQGKVFTSTAQGLTGQSFGWINYDLLSEDTILPHMNGYGGENRLWIGPEGGQFSVFFKQGVKMEIANWFTPPAIDTEPWNMVSKSDSRVSLKKEMILTNYSGTEFKLRIDRNIQLLDQPDAETVLGTDIPKNVDWVGYRSINKMTNTGDKEWTRKTGALSIWILSMFPPGPHTTAVIPFTEGNEKRLGPIATTNYFGEIRPARIQYGKGVIFFKVDGKKRRKLGLAPGRAKPICGSYDEDKKILTIIRFSIPPGIVDYVNQLWERQEYPFLGDVMNLYNDGPLEDGGRLGPFYEIESSSPAAFLAPEGKIIHEHDVFHFVGEESNLNILAKALLGVDIEEIKEAF